MSEVFILYVRIVIIVTSGLLKTMQLSHEKLVK